MSNLDELNTTLTRMGGFVGENIRDFLAMEDQRLEKVGIKQDELIDTPNEFFAQHPDLLARWILGQLRGLHDRAKNHRLRGYPMMSSVNAWGHKAYEIKHLLSRTLEETPSKTEENSKETV